MEKFIPLGALLIFMLAFTATGYAASPDKKSDEERLLALTAKAMSGNITITATALHDIALKKDPGQVIVSLQSLEEYNQGHVPGAIHLPIDLADLATATQRLPKDKTIILVSSNGQEACKIALVLRQLGYDAKSAMLGMNAYNRLYAGAGAYMGNIDGKVSTEEAAFTPASPKLHYSDLSDEELIRRNTAAYAHRFRPFNITAYELLEADEVVLISMQMPEDYAKGHIPGAINIPGPIFLAGDPRLLQLPKDKKIFVTCYIGHYSSLGAMLLNQMGYEAYSLAWGFSGWNTDSMSDELKQPLTKGLGFEVEARKPE